LTGSIVVFRGTSYAGRDSSYDEVFSIPTNLAFTGVSEVVMDKLTGYPQTTGTTTLTTVSGDSHGLTINSKGMVTW